MVNTNITPYEQAAAYKELGLVVLTLGFESKIPNKGMDGWPKFLTYENQLDYIAKQQKCNIGMVCGEASGIMILDLDKPKDGEIDSIEYYDELCKKNGDPTPSQVRTRSGGYHLYFKNDSELVHGVRKSFNGIKNISWDLLASGNHYCVMPPSQVHTDIDGGKENGPLASYEWIRDLSNLKPMPQWLKDGFIAGQNKHKPKVEYVNVKSDEKVTYDWEQIEELIELVKDNDNRDNWLKMGNILKNCGKALDNLEYGFELWNSWSSSSDKYDEATIERTYDGLNNNWNFGTLCILAKEEEPEK